MCVSFADTSADYFATLKMLKTCNYIHFFSRTLLFLFKVVKTNSDDVYKRSSSSCVILDPATSIFRAGHHPFSREKKSEKQCGHTKTMIYLYVHIGRLPPPFWRLV